jgi:hypothetical protein
MMSLMARGFFAGSPLMILPVFTLCLFLAIFTAVCWRTYRRTAATEHDRMSRLPLEDGAAAALTDGGARG